MSCENLANPWWSAQVGGLGMDPAAYTPPLKPDHGEISMNSAGRRYSRSREEEEEERENGEPALEVGTKRPRGRPPGSKNKPKPPVIINQVPSNSLQSTVMEVATGTDIAESMAKYARRRRRGICVLSANGWVANVTLTQPAAQGTSLALYGRYEILSLSGTFLPDPAPQGTSVLTVYLAGAQGRVVGGTVVGSLVAAGTVIIMAATFSNAIYQRLPMEEEGDREKESGGYDGGIGQAQLINPSPTAEYTSNLPSNLAYSEQCDVYNWAEQRSNY